MGHSTGPRRRAANGCRITIEFTIGTMINTFNTNITSVHTTKQYDTERIAFCLVRKGVGKLYMSEHLSRSPRKGDKENSKKGDQPNLVVERNFQLLSI